MDAIREPPFGAGAAATGFCGTLTAFWAPGRIVVTPGRTAFDVCCPSLPANWLSACPKAFPALAPAAPESPCASAPSTAAWADAKPDNATKHAAVRIKFFIIPLLMQPTVVHGAGAVNGQARCRAAQIPP